MSSVNNFNNINNIKEMRELSLGKKIRQLRIERKITQQELVGDFITRNMLSQIENDAATPSIKTLQYIADNLEVPLSFLMQGENDREFAGNFEYGNTETINSNAKKIFFDGDYKEYIQIIESSPHIITSENKDAALFLGFAYLAVTTESFSNGEIDKCLEYCEKTKKICENNFNNIRDFNNIAVKQIRYQADLYKVLCQPIILDLSNISESSANQENQEQYEDYTFLKNTVESNGLCRYDIISAYKYMKNCEPKKSLIYLKEAEQIMENLRSTNSANSTNHPYREDLYKLFESCYVTLEDYKNAHLYSSKLLSLYSEKNKK